VLKRNSDKCLGRTSNGRSAKSNVASRARPDVERCTRPPHLTQEIALKSRSLLEGSFHTPEMLEIVGKAYDDAWSEIAHRFDGDAEKARLQLAHAMLAVAPENGQNPKTLKNAALKLMALAYGDQPDSKGSSLRPFDRC
jgi:hypothetical protein